MGSRIAGLLSSLIRGGDGFGFDDHGIIFFFAQLARSFFAEALSVAFSIARRDIEQLTNPVIDQQRLGCAVKLFEVMGAPLIAFAVLV